MGAVSGNKSFAKSFLSISLRLLVNAVGVIVLRSIFAGDGVGGRLGQWDTQVMSLESLLLSLLSGSIVVGGKEAADVAEADTLCGNAGWT